MWTWASHFLDISFWQHLLTTVLGVALGIPAALWVDRSIRRHQQRAERGQLIEALSQSLEENLSLVNRLESELSDNRPDPQPTDPLDLMLLNSTSITKYESLDSIRVCQSIDSARYRLTCLDSKLENARKLLGDSNRSALVRAVMQRFNQGCVAQIPDVRSAIESAKRELQELRSGR
jgi:hypothetical protein